MYVISPYNGSVKGNLGAWATGRGRPQANPGTLSADVISDGTRRRIGTPFRTAPPLLAVTPDDASLLTVIPDGPQGRAGIQTGATQMRAPPARTAASQAIPARALDPGFRLRRPRDDVRKQSAVHYSTVGAKCLSGTNNRLALPPKLSNPW